MTVAIPHQSRYHTSSVYVLPADEEEKKRFEYQQKLVASVFEHRAVIAPVNLAGAEILDIATGSGAWSLDVLKRHPEASTAVFNCVDIEPRLFPSPPPPNMTFHTMSVLKLAEEWANRFTFIHQRLLLVGLKYDEWALAIKEIYRVTAPGGWVQLCEIYPLNEISGPSSRKMIQLVEALVKHIGLDFKCNERIPSLLKTAGFTSVNVERRSFMLGQKWGGEIGKGMAENQIGVWKGMKTPILREGGFGLVKDEKEYDKLVEEVEHEWNTYNGAEMIWFTFTAQKPL